jgi:hypothetical protein
VPAQFWIVKTISFALGEEWTRRPASINLHGHRIPSLYRAAIIACIILVQILRKAREVYPPAGAKLDHILWRPMDQRRSSRTGLEDAGDTVVAVAPDGILARTRVASWLSSPCATSQT